MISSDLNFWKQVMSTPLGIEAQLDFAPPHRKLVANAATKSKVAATLLLLYPDVDGNLAFPLIQRPSNNPLDKHKGQISFPGGRQEPNDLDLSATALRETYEEIGVNSDEVTILGPLTELYVPVSNFIIYPYVGIIDHQPTFIPQPEEVDQIISMKVSSLIDENAKKKKEMTFARGQNNYKLKDVPYFDLNGKVVWGATAMMLSEFRKMVLKYI